MSRVLLLLMCLGVTGPVSAQAPYIAYGWEASGDPPSLCVYSAQLALEQLGFQVTAAGSSEVVGRQDDYKAVIACLPDRRLFMVAGPVYRHASALIEQFRATYDAE